MRRSFILVYLSVVAAGCHSDSTGPTRVGSAGSLGITCSLVSPNTLGCAATVQCTLYGCPPGTPTDVTNAASWEVDNAGIVRIVGPARFEAAAAGDTFVRARWTTAEGKRTMSVFPGQPPLPTYSVWGSIWEAGKTLSSAPLSGVLVEVIDGPLVGRTVTTGVPAVAMPGYPAPHGGAGGYEFQGAPPGTYRLRATKAGYFPQEKIVTVSTGSSDGGIQLTVVAAVPAFAGVREVVMR